MLVCVALLVLASAPALALAAGQDGPSARSSRQPALGVSVQPVTRLYPGASPGLSVVFRNGEKFDELLTAATTSTPGAPGCPPAMFTLSTYHFRPAVRLRPGHRVTKRLPFGLRAAAPAACQERTFTVRVTGRVVQR